MEFTYRYRKYIARFSFIPYLLILLLALNFKIWGVICSEDDIENLIVNQSKDLEHCIITNIINSDNIIEAIQIKQLPAAGFVGIIACCLLALSYFILTDRSNLLFKRRDTLVSLCVRMDD